MEKKKGHFWPILCLLLLAPATGELLSGSSPPTEYFQPFSFILLTVLYGSGALLVRELARRWKVGWISIFLLGMAYGIYEEGILVRSFFDPGWMDLDVLGVYGRAWGVNWIWSIALTLFHAAISISVPILLVELAFPSHKNDPWLSKRGLIVFGVLLFSLILVSPFLSLYITPGGILFSLISIVVFVFFAKKGVLNQQKSDAKKAVKPLGVFVLFLILMIAFIFGMWGFPALNIPVWMDIVFLIGLPWLALVFIRRMGVNGWDERHAWSAAFGLLLPWLFLSVVAETENAVRPDDTGGMSLAALVALLLLLALRAAIQKRLKRKQEKRMP